MAVVIDLIGFGVVFPILPVYARRFHASSATATGLVAAFAAASFVFSPLWGRVSDRVGRKPILLLSLAGTCVGSLITGVAGGVAVLYVGRVVDGISGASVSVAQAAVSDVAAPEQRARLFGLLGAAFGLGFVAGPAIGAVAALVGPRVPFYIAGALAGINAVVAARRLPETNPVAHGAEERPAAGRLAGGDPTTEAGAGRPGGDAARVAGAGRPGAAAGRVAGAGPQGGAAGRVAGAGRPGGAAARVAGAGRPGAAAGRVAGAGRLGAAAGRVAGAGRPADAEVPSVGAGAAFESPEATVRNPWAALAGGRGVGPLIGVAFGTLLAFSAFEATFALFGQRRLGFGIGSSAAVFAVIGLAIVAVQGALVHPVVSRIGEVATLRAGLTLDGIGLVVAAFARSWLALAPALLALTVGQGLVQTTMSSALAGRADPRRRGEVLGAQQSAGGLARVAGPLLGGVLFQRLGPGAPYIAGAGVLAVVLLLFQVARVPQPSGILD
jgi:multidrug resistance protein